MPSSDHILRVQERKNGLVSSRFVVDGVQYTFYDVSAQKNRRKKWISNFQDDVKMIIFFVGLDQFNEPSRQNHAVDGVTHAMAEFLELLEEKSLCSLPILVVLNRHDVFCKKVQSNCHGNTCQSFQQRRFSHECREETMDVDNDEPGPVG